jgi:hypothetical protein
MTAVYQNILTATQTKLQGLSLTGIDDANIIIREVGSDAGVTLPGIVIVPQRPVMNPRAGTSAHDDVAYPVLVAMFAADNHAQSKTDTYTDWLQTIARAFRHQRLSGVPEVFDCEVSPGDAIDRQGWDAQKFVGLTVLRFISREPRGV